MATTETEKKENVLEDFERGCYSYLSRLSDKYKRRVLFTDAGKARLASIAGYIVGLEHAGKEDFAEKMANEIHSGINRLCTQEDTEFVVSENAEGSKETISVPPMKATLHDDGCMHCFSVLWYRALDPKVYEAKLTQAQATLKARRDANEEVWDTAHQLVVKELRIMERIDPSAPYSEELNEYRFAGGHHIKIYYVPSHNGGLIYHGPGGGENFTVNLDTSGALWGIHT